MARLRGARTAVVGAEWATGARGVAGALGDVAGAAAAAVAVAGVETCRKSAIDCQLVYLILLAFEILAPVAPLQRY